MAVRNPPAERAIDQAIAWREAGRGAEAVVLLNQALALAPGNARLWQTLGTVHRALEQSAAAITAFARAAELAPGDLRPAYGVAQASLEAGRPAAALFERLRAMAPGEGSILLGRAAAQLAEGRGEEAILSLAATVAANPHWTEGQATLAQLRWQLGDPAGPAAGYRTALAGAPADRVLWLGLIDLHLHGEDFSAAAAAVAEARAVLGDDPGLRLPAARLASERGDTGVADRAFAELSGHADAAIVEQHCRHLLRTGRPAAAFARLEPWLAGPQADALWPYASIAWRLTDDSRHAWLEGDPALVGVYALDLPDLSALAARLRTLHRARRDPFGQSVRGGTQTDGPLLAHEAPEIRDLRAAVVDAVERHVATLGPRDEAHPSRRHVGKPLRFTGSWSVRLSGAGHHSSHIHPQGWLSSACYVALPEPDERGAAPAGWLQLGAPPAGLGLDLPPLRTIEPVPGQLVLFPSTMWHGTVPIAAGERLTVAFDIAPWPGAS